MIHPTNRPYVGDGHGQSVFEYLVPYENQWHNLPDKLSNSLDILADRIKFDTFNDPDAALMPLAQIGRPQLVRGMTQSAAGIPTAQYLLAGSRRIWIAVANHHHQDLSRCLPSK